MQALEASLGGLEGSQAEGFRRLGGSLQSALAGAEESLGAAVRSEARRSLEPVRRLPELLAAAMPVTPEVVMAPDGLLVRRFFAWRFRGGTRCSLAAGGCWGRRRWECAELPAATCLLLSMPS